MRGAGRCGESGWEFGGDEGGKGRDEDGRGGSEGGSCELGAGSGVGMGRVASVESVSCVTFFRLGDFRVEVEGAFSFSLPFFFAEALDFVVGGGSNENSSSEPEVSSMMSLSGIAFATFPLERIFVRSAISSE